MWAIRNYTRYKAGKTWARDKQGVHEWIVAVKATFDIQPDSRLSVAEEQVEPLLAPEYSGEPGLSSLRYEADLVSPKPATDILINGTAYAPGGTPSSEFLVAARFGAVKKTLRVRGDRIRGDGAFGGYNLARPLTQVPIVYERAFGGYDCSDPDVQKHRMDPRNPVGCGLKSHAGTPIGTALPNFGISGWGYCDFRPGGIRPDRELLVTAS